MLSKLNPSFTINAELMERFNKFTKEHCINKSSLIEKLIKEYLEKHDKNM